MEQIDRTFCDNVFDFGSANLSKKKLRRKLEQLMPELRNSLKTVIFRDTRIKISVFLQLF